MSATTTAIFSALGISWASIFGTVTTAVGQAGQVLLDIFLALWPLWLGIGVLLFVIGIPWYLYHRATQGR
jgi:putative Mn2+ efflux pump MntP